MSPPARKVRLPFHPLVSSLRARAHLPSLPFLSSLGRSSPNSDRITLSRSTPKLIFSSTSQSTTSFLVMRFCLRRRRLLCFFDSEFDSNRVLSRRSSFHSPSLELTYTVPLFTTAVSERPNSPESSSPIPWHDTTVSFVDRSSRSLDLRKRL